MSPSAFEAMQGEQNSLGPERWRKDDLAQWLKAGLAEEEAAQPSMRVWRAIDRELSVTPPRQGWLRLRHAYAPLGSAMALAYALSLGALFLAQRAAPSLGGCGTGCQWDSLSEAEAARQAKLGYLGADAHPGWVFQLPPPPPVDRSVRQAERYERRLLAEWGQAGPLPQPVVDPVLSGGIDMD